LQDYLHLRQIRFDCDYNGAMMQCSTTYEVRGVVKMFTDCIDGI
jgi:hypothetical protein